MEYAHKPLEKYVRLIQWGEDKEGEINLSSIELDETEKFKKSLLNRKDGFSLEYFNDNVDFEQNKPETRINEAINNSNLSEEEKAKAQDAANQLAKLAEQNARQKKELEEKQKQIDALQRQTKNLDFKRSEASFSTQLTHHFPAFANLLDGAVSDLNKLRTKIPALKDDSTYLIAMRKIRRVEGELQAMKTLLLHTDVELRSPQFLDWVKLTKWYFSISQELTRVNVDSNPNVGDSWLIKGNAIGVTMMLHNLYQNAQEHGAQYIQFDFSKTELKISSDSAAIAGEDLEKIFELGYSTKPQGTGIGLHQVRAFLKQVGCTIYAENKNSLVCFIIKREGK